MADFSFFLPLPKKTKVLVKKGQDITTGQKVASCQELTQKKINLTKRLKTTPKNVSRFLLVGLGEKINIEQPLAKIDQLFKKIIISSSVQGQVFAFDNNTGILTIEVAQQSHDLLSPLDGQVEKVNQEGITIKINADEIFDLVDGWGENQLGQLAYHQGNLMSLTCQYQDKIILVDKNDFSPALVNKAQAIGCLAIITDQQELKNSQGEEITFGQIKSADKEKLIKFAGQNLIIDNQQKKLAIKSNHA